MEETNKEYINNIRTLIYTQKPANIELAFQLMANVVEMPLAEALRVLFVELITLREHTSMSGKKEEPFVDFVIYGVGICYYWDRNGIYCLTNTRELCIQEMDRYHLLHPNNIRELCIEHFHQHFYQFAHLIALAIDRSKTRNTDR